MAHVFMKELAQAQKLTVDHLRRALDYVEERKLRCGRYEETARHLAAVRFAYQGVPVVVMEDIRAEKVIAAWPKVGQAAVQDALTFAPEELRAKLLDPVPCLKPVHAWPQEPHKSRVRATDDEWNKDVGAAYERGLMVADELDEGFKDQKGRPVLNGAGAVKKEKKVDGKVVSAQRFISNLIPSNMFQDRLEGDDKLLPYLGQLTLLQQEEEEVWLGDSEDFTSCFNLFRLPPDWHKFMAFEKPADAALLGGWQERWCTLQWLAVWQWVRVFKEAEIPQGSEVAKTQLLPADEDLTVIYLDSYDQLRRFKKGCEEVVKAEMSERHKRFLKVCEKLALPLNDGKRLVASTLGALQGGVLDGEEGRFGLSVQKVVEVITSGSTLLAKEKWSEGELRHVVGKATFGCCFRRPLFAILESVFEEINVRASQNDREVPRPGAWDEVAIRVLLTPLMYSYLKARIDPEVSVTDASPSGGGAATAVEFQSAPCTIDVAGPMAESLALKESFMVKGQEKEHLATLLRQATNRGSDVRSFLEVDGEMHEQLFFWL